jgi:hypothetical protein
VSESARVKGAGIRPFLHWYGATWGMARLRKHAETIPNDLQRQLDLRDPYLGILGSTWYPAAIPHALLDSVEADHTPAEREAIVRDGGRALIESTLNGVYKWLFEQMMTPDRYARNAGKLFSRYYEPGALTKTALGPTSHLTQIEGWGAHHPVLCDFILHTAVYVYGMLGCKELAVRRTACLRNGDADCRFETSWS